MSFLENTRKPAGLGGKIMVSVMNLGHSPLANWGMKFLSLSADAKILDCGCGGGATVNRLLKKYPQGIVKGLDYSPVSVEKARKLNEAAIYDGRCVISQGSADRIIFASEWFDAVTAFETIYFWPNLAQCFDEIYRVLKPNGTFLICNECGDTAFGRKWESRIDGMTIYTEAQLTDFLKQSGFHDIQIHKHKKGWLCITAQK